MAEIVIERERKRVAKGFPFDRILSVSLEAMSRSLRTDSVRYRCVTETRTMYRAGRRRPVVYFTLHAARVKMSVSENSPTSLQRSQSENFELPVCEILQYFQKVYEQNKFLSMLLRLRVDKSV